MIGIRKSEERGRTQRDWLDSRHTFSFGGYYDRRYQSFRKLRVINEDRVRPGMGFQTHAHRDMEIITYVIEGALAHKDSMENSSIIGAGEVQRMSAGTGVQHSEFNPSRNEPVHLLQIWIVPEREGLEPGYEQRNFAADAARNRWLLIAARDGRDGSVTVHQDVQLWISRLDSGGRVTYRLKSDRHAWLQVVRGEVTLNDTPLRAGDGAAVSQEEIIEAGALADAELLLFDLA